MSGPAPGEAARAVVAVIGVGNPYRRDDAAGPTVLAALRRRFGTEPRVRLVELDGEPVGIVQSWAGAELVVIVDAVRSDAPAGTIHRFDGEQIRAGGARGIALGGGHLLGVADAIELARTMGSLPPVLQIVGIEGEHYGLGEGVGEVVASACEEVATRLGASIDAWLTCAVAAI